MNRSFATARRQTQGTALILTLAFLVLISAVVAIFLSRVLIEQRASNNSANQTRVDLLAHSAVDVIVGDLKQEIVNGSTSTNVGTGTNATTIYFPISPTNMVPQRIGLATNSSGTDFAPNLIRRSVRNDTLAAPSHASAVNSTTDASFYGRAVKISRWNLHYLIPRASAGSTTIDTTPTNYFTAPDWVMVGTNGASVITTPNTNIIGRYAYAIYDEGGLLDANVAGYPSGMTTYMTNQVALKGSLAMADLTAIGLSTADIDNLVGWRNYATMQPASGSFGSYSLSGDSTAATNYYSYVSAATNGFLAVNPKQYNNRTDQAFASRQELLKFQRATGFSQDALQYLGTFTRTLEQPTYYPDPNRPKNIAYYLDRDNANDTCGTTASHDSTGANQDGINPSLLLPRNATGQALIKRRFPLSRLSLIEQAANTLRAGGTVSSSLANQIYDYFGLTWDSANLCWTYNHGDSTRIYKLSEITSATNPDGTTREPDFFELLKAAINCDSLGKQEGEFDPSGTPHGATGSLIDGQIHIQLMQIGANLIDQYDADSYPTAIAFNGSTLYGVENLPYLAGWQQMWYRMKALTWGTDIDTTLGTPPSSGTVYESQVMIQPIIWNPHAPDSNPSPTGVPTNFRVIASGNTDVAVSVPFHPQVAAAWWTSGDTHQQTSFPATAAYAALNSMTKSGSFYTFPNTVVDPATAILTFNTGSGDAAFREPFRLRAPNYPAGSNAANDPGYTAGQITIGADSTLVAADGGNTTAIGFNCGKVWTGPAIDTADDQKYLSVGSVSRDLKLKLQYKLGSSWYTYDVIQDIYNASGNVSTVDNQDSYPYIRSFRTCWRVDPRTDRWGLTHMVAWPSNNSTDVPSGLTFMPSNGVDANYANNNPKRNYLPQGITLKPNAASSYITITAPAGTAAAEGWFQPSVLTSGVNAGDLMANLGKSNSSLNANTGSTTSPVPGLKFYYADPDGVMRRAMGGNFSGNDGLPMYTGNTNSRPVVLNRPFQSVAEMGYASRGMAWKQLDFCNAESGDSALLDVFCLNDLQNAPSNVAVAGRVNLNTRQPKVLQALIQGSSKIEGGTLSSTEAAAAAQALVTWTSDSSQYTYYLPGNILNQGPLRNRGELVGKFIAQVAANPAVSLTGGQTPVLDVAKSYSGYSSKLTSPTVFSTTADAAIERRRSSVVRALADSGNVRTWNLLIDVIAQTGRYPASATSSSDLARFIVTGETHYWVHVALDRYTGTVIAISYEQVSE